MRSFGLTIHTQNIRGKIMLIRRCPLEVKFRNIVVSRP